MISTIYTVAGMTTAEDARAIKDRLYLVAGIGAVATEIIPDGEARIILKHKDDVELNRSAIEAAVQEAGEYTLA
ncbi:MULTISPECIES: hypothetical protein [Micrococcales]|uniref:Uncharacterized protein n=4 Tax=Micrococcales TaxID=85006 RepID=A0A7X6KY58_9CELL|nr:MULTISPECIES: hypothetical protein [Micrococcales]MBD7982868.1 hypothetical protein [Oerskovia merdavium]MCA5891745.1 hypothetical protein [Isoptericola sp. NEAU-Y5]MCA5894578.1 hypothetical protein [Isoptericola sp. NEAU-Y5]NKY24361.1 hypothetical protein [Cellulomonas denverensis]QUC01930.1 hypothetical protein J5A69_20035 [Cellulosimicrobium cellulans]